MTIPKRPLGKTGVDVTILGLGGEGILRTYRHEEEAYDLINSAIDAGIGYFESARAYSGSESYYGQALKERRQEIFLTSKSHARDREGALQHLEQTLENMATDHLDLWQVHDVRTKEDMEQIFGPGGAIEAFAEAREKGLTRFVGVTGHHDPEILSQCLDRYDFDTVLLPVNPAEPAYNSFMEMVIPKAVEKSMGIIGMKVYFRGLATQLPGFKSVAPFFQYALTHPLSTAVIGCDSVEQMLENVMVASTFESMEESEMRKLETIVAPFADRLMYYKPQQG